jgi:glycosyltransferase involved in cell wall biosynthesis
MRCRVVHLTSVHYAFDTRIFHKECKSLAAAGYDVSLVAQNPQCDPPCDGITLITVPSPKNRSERLSHTIWSVYQAAVRANAEIYHFHDPELMPVGLMLKAQGKKVIYDVHEDYRNSVLHAGWLPPALRRFAAAGVGMGEMAMSRTYDRIIAATPTIGARFPSAKTYLVQNFPWRDELCPPASISYELREPIAVYVGRLANDRGLREMVQAVQLASGQVPVKLVTAGDVKSGAPADIELGRGTGLVEHKGLLSRSDVAVLAARARIGLAVLHPLESFKKAQPTKLYEYMAAGLPVVASDFPVWRQIVESASCGLLVNPLDPSAIAEALVWLLRHPSEAKQMGRNGQDAVNKLYNWERESERLISIYSELQATPMGRGSRTKLAAVIDER